MQTIRNSHASLTIATLLLSGFAAAANGAISKSVQDEIALMDGDGNGKISATEHASGAKAMFTDMDVNKDGLVTVAEMDAKQASRNATDNAAAPKMTSAEKIAVIDTDKDGVLSAEEHATGSRTMFEKMDKDQDGFVTAEELQAGHDEMLKPRKQA